MPSFGAKSLAALETCDFQLQRLFYEVVKHFDCSILEGHRTLERQQQLYAEHKTRTMRSQHLAEPSRAVDVAPYPTDWTDTARFRVFGGFVLGVASQLGIALRWGGDWDGDTDLKDQTFDDLVHFELAES